MNVTSGRLAALLETAPSGAAQVVSPGTTPPKKFPPLISKFITRNTQSVPKRS